MESAAQRRERLRELRKSLADGQASAEESSEPLRISFRNYNPLSDNLKTLKKDATQSETLEAKALEIQRDIPEETPSTEPLELNNLVPRKPGFDLARELEIRSERLEQETNYCIAELIRQRLKEQKDFSLAAEAEAQFDDLDD
ncbi:Coiled-coil domain-containing protein 12 [Dinochytrium kinnereticum]|nr:Coiled-coil domain-containing protein 12 [Dinochytrium kinnereticum]